MTKFKKYLLEKEISQNELANAIGMDKHTMSKIAQGHILPTKKDIDKICLFLSCSINDLFLPEEIPGLTPSYPLQPVATTLKREIYIKYIKRPLKRRRYKLTTEIDIDLWAELTPDKLKEFNCESLSEFNRIAILEKLKK